MASGEGALGDEGDGNEGIGEGVKDDRVDVIEETDEGGDDP